MPIHAFEKIVYPVRMPSPFLAKGKGQVKGTGGIIAHSDVPEGPFESDLKKRAAMSASTSALTPRVAASAVPSGSGQAPLPPVPQFHPQVPPRTPGIGSDKSILSAAGVSTSAHIEKIPPETGTPFWLGEITWFAHVYLAKLFDRDPETNEVLWFAAPPLNQPRPKGPRHSLAYLQFIAAKRKKSTAEGDDTVDAAHPAKRTRASVVPTVTETMRQIVEGMR
jgi:chromatin structure-remodeling complex subunit RSC1/2